MTEFINKSIQLNKAQPTLAFQTPIIQSKTPQLRSDLPKLTTNFYCHVSTLSTITIWKGEV